MPTGRLCISPKETPLRRGEVYDARLDPTEGSEQAGTRPVIIVSRDAINAASPVIIVVPCTTYRPGRQLYPSQVLLRAPDGGLAVDSVALGEQVRALATSRLGRRRGQLSPQALTQLDRALPIALDLPGSP
jgi:mRNA interferase MazF